MNSARCRAVRHPSRRAESPRRRRCAQRISASPSRSLATAYAASIQQDAGVSRASANIASDSRSSARLLRTSPLRLDPVPQPCRAAQPGPNGLFSSRIVGQGAGRVAIALSASPPAPVAWESAHLVSAMTAPVPKSRIQGHCSLPDGDGRDIELAGRCSSWSSGAKLRLYRDSATSFGRRHWPAPRRDPRCSSDGWRAHRPANRRCRPPPRRRGTAAPLAVLRLPAGR